ncbi:MAG: putative Zn-dependent protease [Cryomorphaceae bacterium]|jgi:predicted Zn-dependent protease
MQRKIRLMGQLMIVTACLVLSGSFVSAQAALTGKALKVHQQYMAGNVLYDDPKLAAYVRKVGQKMLANSDHAGREYHFFLLDNPIPNATTPGQGLVYVHRGLLAILNSEAQLAGVLGHEIGHNVGKHIAKRKGQYYGGNIIANIASLLVGNSSVGQAIALQNNASLSSFGREAELESDTFAGEYLYAAKYDPQEMLYALSALADFNSFYSRTSGGAPAYHSVFSTHPRTDKRLQGLIRQVGTLPPGEEFIGRDEYRAALEGMVYGPNYRPNAPKGYERYINESLGITFIHPTTWARTLKGSNIILKDVDGAIQLKISLQKTSDRSKSTTELLQEKYPDDLGNVEKFDARATRDLGALGTRPNRRVALSNVARNTFNFEGIAKNNVITEYQDQVMVYIIRSFRRMTPQDQAQDALTHIFYKRLEPGESFASMARDLAIKDPTAEEQLRLLNGYPKGEAEPGTWIKILKKVKISKRDKFKAEKEEDQPQEEQHEGAKS